MMDSKLSKLEDIYNSYVNNLQPSPDLYDCIFGVGNIDSNIVLVGEAPGANEIKQKKPFVGSAGKKLDEFLKQLELKREDIYITNTVKYRPTQKSPKTGNLINRTPGIDEIKYSASYLMSELQTVDPDLVITLGNISLRAITQDFNLSITKVHGELINTQIKFKIFPLFHPASIIYNNSILSLYEQDIKKLKLVLNNFK